MTKGNEARILKSKFERRLANIRAEKFPQINYSIHRFWMETKGEKFFSDLLKKFEGDQSGKNMADGMLGGSFSHPTDSYQRASYGYHCLKQFEPYFQTNPSYAISRIFEGKNENEKYWIFLDRYCFDAYFEYLLDYLDEIINSENPAREAIPSPKLFVSWSGQVSKEISKILIEVLGSNFSQIQTFFTPTDIKHGRRWEGELADELERANYAILVITKDNYLSPWIHFEAGAISKHRAVSRVFPICFGFRKENLEEPLKEFQAADFNAEEMMNVLVSLKDIFKIPEDLFKGVVENFLKELESRILKVLMSQETARSSSEELGSFLDEAQESINECLVPINESLARDTGLVYLSLDYLGWAQALKVFLDSEKFSKGVPSHLRKGLSPDVNIVFSEAISRVASLKRLVAEAMPKLDRYSKIETFEPNSKAEWMRIREKIVELKDSFIGLIQRIEKSRGQ